MDDVRLRHQIEVRFRDCDAMGHINNAVYFTYFEEARFAYWREISRGRPGKPASMILARAECDFKAPAGLGDLLEVQARVTAIGRTSFTMEYEIVDRKDRRLIARGRSVQVIYDYAAGRPIPMPDELRERIEDYEGRTLASQADRRQPGG